MRSDAAPGAGDETLLASADDLAHCIGTDPRLDGWSLTRRGAGYLEIQRGEVMLILAWPRLWTDADELAPHLVRARSGNWSLLLFGSDAEFHAHRVDALGGEYANVTAVPVPAPVERIVTVLRAWGSAYRMRMDMAKAELALERARYEIDLLINVGRALSQQQGDLDGLLQMILSKAREVTGADAGSIYIVAGGEDDDSERKLRFTHAQNTSQPALEMENPGIELDVSASSIVGACVLSGEVINIPDLYALDEPGTGNNPWGFVHDKQFDQKYDYQTRAMVTVPMISARRQVIGVIQLINKYARGVLRLENTDDFATKVVPFDEVSIHYARSLASQAGIAMENAQLNQEVREVFEGFVKASVVAIEKRDPTTSGHSVRVADLTVRLAEVTDRVTTGPYADLRFTHDDIQQISFAALLHDFGKVGVREHVLVKPKKLYKEERQLIESRFEFIRRTMENELLERKVEYLLRAERDRVAEELATFDRDAQSKLEELDDFLQFILKCNQPSLLEQGGFERIADIASRTYRSLDGRQLPYLTEEETIALQIPRGSLTVEERKQIEDHVVHTFEFLSTIPWGKTFQNIPDIAHAHHEKLDGSGYPLGLGADQIPAPSKMMTISDIYDALTASDRPYKKAVPVDKALDILSSEVGRGKLDSNLFQLFLDAKIWQLHQ